jgi:RecB family exonuclease
MPAPASTTTSPRDGSPPGHIGLLPDRLSPRDIGDYRICPRRIWFRRVIKMPDNQQNTAVLMLGNAVHAALYLFFGLPLDQRQPAEQRLHQCLRSVWKSFRRPGLFATREAEQASGLKGLDLLSRFSESCSTDVVPLLRERWVQTRLPNGVVLFGKADRVDPLTSGGAEQDDTELLFADSADSRRQGASGELEPVDIVDYKTGLRTIDAEDLPDEPAAQIYLLGAESTLRRPVRRVRLSYLAHGIESRWEPEREDVDELREHPTDLTTQMIRDRSFRPHPGVHCVTCPYAASCPDAGRTALSDLQAVADDLGF